MKNKIQEGKVLSFTAPYALSAGDGFLVGGIFAVAVNDAVIATAVEGCVEGVYELTKVGSQAWAVGDPIYWDDTERYCTTEKIGNTFIGYATEAAGSGAGVTTGIVRLVPTRHAYTGIAGEAETGATAVEWGDVAHHTTILTLDDFALGTSGDNANLALGAKLYTFPEGIIAIESAQFIGLGITADISVTTDTPEVGLGTTQASGQQATLGAVAATAENISEGGDTTNIAPDVAGTATINSSKKCMVASGDDGPLIIAAAGAHTVYLNVADGWANVTAAGPVTADGIVVLNWKRLTT